MQSLTPILVVYVISMMLILSEIVVPGFIVGLFGVSGLAASIYYAYVHHGFLTGTALLLIAVAIVPVTLVKGLRRLSLRAQVDGNASPLKDAELLGALGRALTPLRPTGVALFLDRRIDVVTRGEPVEKGSSVQVLAVEGNRVIVGNADRRN